MDTQSCIRTIQWKPSGLSIFRVSSKDKIKCISELAAYEDNYLDDVILSATRDEDPTVQEAAAHVIISRFSKWNGVREVEERFRDATVHKTDPSLWYRTMPPEMASVLVCIASINHNGYVREAALGSMAAMPHQRFIPFVLRRTGDWVQQVRDHALRTLLLHKTFSYRGGFFAAIHDIGALLEIKRVDLDPIYREVMRWLVSNVQPLHLLAEIQGLQDSARFKFIRYLMAEQQCDQLIIASLLKDRSFLIRLTVVRHLDQRTEEWTRPMLEEALQDGSPSVRREAFRSLVRRKCATREVLLNGLIDTAYDIRESAAKGLSFSREALQKHYHEQLQIGHSVVGSILGLADVKATYLIPEIEQYTTAAKPDVRMATLMALAKLAPERAYDHAMDMVVDPNKRIRKKAEDLLLESHDQVVHDRAKALLSLKSEIHRLAGLSLLSKFGGWQALAGILEACLDNSPRVGEQAWVNLHSWFAYARRLFTEPQLNDLENARRGVRMIRSNKAQLTNVQTSLLNEVDKLL